MITQRELEDLRDKFRTDSDATEQAMSRPDLSDNQKFFLGGLSQAYSRAADDLQEMINAFEARMLFRRGLIR